MGGRKGPAIGRPEHRSRKADGRRRNLPFAYRVELLPDGWTSIYETPGGEGVQPQKLTVVHVKPSSSEMNSPLSPAA